MKLQLNLAQVRLSKNELDLLVRPFGKDERMSAIRAQLPKGWEAYRDGTNVYCWRYHGNEPAPTTSWQPVKVNLGTNAQLFSHLIEQGVIRLLQASGFQMVKRTIPLLVNTTANLLDGKLTTPLDRRVAIHPVYTIEGIIKGNSTGIPDILLTIGTKTQWRLTIPVAELAAQGFNCVGLGVRLASTAVPKELEHLAGKLVGIVKRIDGDVVELGDPFDSKTFRVPSKLVHPEGSRQSVKRYVDSANRANGTQTWVELLKVNDDQTKSNNILKRVREIAKLLGQKPVTLADGLEVQIVGLLPANSSILPIADVSSPTFIFDYASKTRDTLASRGLKNNGPYDKTRPPLKYSKILILCPKTYEGVARTFFKKFRDGCTYPDRKKPWQDFAGFAKVFRLPALTYIEEFFDPTEGGSIGKASELALKRILQKSKDYDLCFALTEDKHKELEAANDPYCIAKGILLAHGIPVSELTAEDISSNDWKLVFVLSNVALQAYAKMGGVPFVLQAPIEDKPELILGVGRADIGSSRFGKKRVVGFATVFKNNGDYLVGAVRPFKDSESYADELAEVVTEGLKEAIQREGFKDGTPVRIIFHIYKKPGEGKELKAIEKVIKNHAQHPLEYAFVNVSDTHSQILVDEDDADGIPPRGKIIQLSKRASLVTLIGPREYLKRGTPIPLKISVDSRSTYQDVPRLVQQVYDFANVTWRGYNIATRPVTIQYAQLAAALAGKLQQTPHWNNTMMETLLRDKRWFL